MGCEKKVADKISLCLFADLPAAGGSSTDCGPICFEGVEHLCRADDGDDGGQRCSSTTEGRVSPMILAGTDRAGDPGQSNR